MKIVGVDHVQLAMPAGEEAKARAFYAGLRAGYDVIDEPMNGRARVYVDDPFGNRIELIERS